jgi:hypothetical protein
MTAFDRAWNLVKSQKPQFNPRDDPEDNGNYPYNAEEAYEAAMRGEPVYHCPSCDAYLDKHICLGHAYPSEIEMPDGYSRMGSAFRQPANATLNPRGHAWMQGGMIRGHENAIPTWKMSARERYGIGYHPVPDPADISEDEGILGMVGGMVGNLQEYKELPDEDKPRLGDWLQDKDVDESRKQRLMHLQRLMGQTGLSSDELVAMLTEQELSDAPDVKIQQRDMRDTYDPTRNDWMQDIFDKLRMFDTQ